MEVAMGKKAEPSPARKARAAAIHAEIDKLTGIEQSGTSPKGKPVNPRNYIQQWMAEHDKKPKDR
jgi:hypothetical protein